jgi:Phasin protein
MANPRPEEKHAEPRQEKSGNPTGTARENIRAISDVGSQIAGSAADISKCAAQTSVEMLGRNKEAAQQLWEHSTELFAHIARQSAEQMGRVLGISGDNAQNGAKKTARSFDALVQTRDVLSSASRDASREWFETARRLIDSTVGRSETLVACRTPNDFFAMQLEIMRDSVEATLHGVKRVSEISAHAATEATQKMSDAAKRVA